MLNRTPQKPASGPSTGRNLQQEHAQLLQENNKLKMLAQKLEQEAKFKDDALTRLQNQLGDEEKLVQPQFGLSQSRAVLLDCFRGKKQNVEDWLYQLWTYFCLTNVSGEQEKMLIAISLLRDQALRWWRYQVQQQESWNYESFRLAIKLKFQTIDRVRVARDKLAMLRQKSSVSSFADEFLDVVMEIPGITQDEQVDRFARALKPNIQTEVFLRNPQTLDEAISIARRYDEITFRSRRNPDTRRRSHQAVYQTPRYVDSTLPSRDFPVKMDLDSMNRTPARG